MTKFSKIAVIKTGWSDDYCNGQVIGAFSYLEKGVGHERFNFRPTSSGCYYGYAPPLGQSQSPPQPHQVKGWLVFFVSKRPGQSGLYLVGWYEKATFAREYKPRPDADELGIDSDGGNFSYTVSSKRACLVPLPLRTKKIKGDHLKRSYAYLRGNGNQDKWREELAKELLAFHAFISARLTDEASIDVSAEILFSRNPERRKAVEEKAVEAVKKHFNGWSCKSVERLNLGYDLCFKKDDTGEKVHVEVKGTSLAEQNFFMSKNEYEYAKELSRNDLRTRHRRDRRGPLWRLAVVHDALANAPVVNIYTFFEMEKLFELSSIAWRGILRKPPDA